MFHSRTDNNDITRKFRISIDMFIYTHIYILTCQKFQVRDGLVAFGCVTSTCVPVLYDIWQVASRFWCNLILSVILSDTVRSLRTLEQLRRVAQLAEGVAGPVCSMLRWVGCNQCPIQEVLSGQFNASNDL